MRLAVRFGSTWSFLCARQQDGIVKCEGLPFRCHMLRSQCVNLLRESSECVNPTTLGFAGGWKRQDSRAEPSSMMLTVRGGALSFAADNVSPFISDIIAVGCEKAKQSFFFAPTKWFSPRRHSRENVKKSDGKSEKNFQREQEKILHAKLASISRRDGWNFEAFTWALWAEPWS